MINNLSKSNVIQCPKHVCSNHWKRFNRCTVMILIKTDMNLWRLSLHLIQYGSYFINYFINYRTENMVMNETLSWSEFCFSIWFNFPNNFVIIYAKNRENMPTWFCFVCLPKRFEKFWVEYNFFDKLIENINFSKK